MPSHQRNGMRTRRDEKTGRLLPHTNKHFLIVTDAKRTEINYINGLKDTLCGSGIGIKIKQENTQANLVSECLRLSNVEGSPKTSLWILFDRDNVPEFDSIIEEAHENDIHVAWSNPCIEIWFSAYFEEIKTYTQSKECIDSFKDIYFNRTGVPYVKNDREIYSRLLRYGDESKAISRVDKKMQTYVQDGIILPSQMAPGTTVSELIKAIRE